MNFVSLYRNILKQHKYFPDNLMKKIGNDYVRQEFKAHIKQKTTEKQLNEFRKSWEDYLMTLRKRDSQKKVGTSINAMYLNQEQIEKLQKFKSELDSITK